MLSYVNIFARDIVALSQFYIDVFGFTEIEKIRSPIFRGLDTGQSSIGFNAQDACDPEQPYYRGEGWYRTRVQVENPFPGGRTVLSFRGAGQTTTVWVASRLAGKHKGGYDEFLVDITDAVKDLPAGQAAKGIPIVVQCDNSPDVNRVPSDLSDFCLYGGRSPTRGGGMRQK